jgi:hypothetical protein
VELVAANAKVTDVESSERAFISNHGTLDSDFSDLETAHTALGKEKEKVEKTEREKAQLFCNLLRKKLACLRHDMEKLVATLGGQCFEFPATNATVGDMLDWFRNEVQGLSTTFNESN